MESIFHRLVIAAPQERVYGALTTKEGLSGWWTPETEATPEVGSMARFAFSMVKWRCQKGHEEWIDTTISFELQPHQKGTTLFFHHDGWKDHTPVFAVCSYDWAIFLRSLKVLCETGNGYPYPNHNK
jgi:hypothetical protein